MKKLILILFCFLFMSCQKTLSTTIVKTPHQEFKVRIAKSLEARAQGLMNVPEMPKNEGMLFEFEQSDFHGFWMKNTLIPLDIIWLSAEKKVVDIQTVQPCQTDPCETFLPKREALYVLEVNAKEFKSNVGDSILWE